MDPARKKQLKDAYKTKLPVGGVYFIECAGNKKRLVKSTVDIEGIKNRFAFSQDINGCPDPAFQNEWKQYGTASFTFGVLEALQMKEGQTSKEFADDIGVLYEMWLDKHDGGKGDKD